MGNEPISCLSPNLGRRESEIYKSSKGGNKTNTSEATNTSIKPYLNMKSDISNGIMNYTHNINFMNFTSRKCSKKNTPSLNKIITLQKFCRLFLFKKKFNEHIDLLSSIIELDANVNLIKDKETKKKMLSNNKGEQLCNKLLTQKKIIPYEDTIYYKKAIKKYKINKYLLYTPLIYIDKYKNNNLYKGTWTLEKNFHGYGTFYASDNKYEGFWNFGKLTGECRYYLHNGDYFIGNFENGMAEGKGNYYHHDATVYEGEWKNDQPNGKGKEIFIDGSFFCGIFEKGLKKSGLFKWNDGSYYEGEIKNNVFEGKGKFHWKEGKEYVGEWVDGKICGKGVMKYVDGAKYEGTFVNGKREGFGKYIWNKNKYYEGEWKKGKQDGKGYFFNKGKGIQGIWKDGSIINYLNNENQNKTVISLINNNTFVSHRYGTSVYYNDSILSLNKNNNSYNEQFIPRMKTSTNRYKNTKYKLNDILSKKKVKNTCLKCRNNYKNKINNSLKDKGIKKSTSKTITTTFNNSQISEYNNKSSFLDNSKLIDKKKAEIKLNQTTQKKTSKTKINKKKK